MSRIPTGAGGRDQRLKAFVPSTPEDLKAYTAAGKDREAQRSAAEPDPRVVRTLRVGDAAVARLRATRDDPPRVTLELLPVGEFDWRESRAWAEALGQLVAWGDEMSGVNKTEAGRSPRRNEDEETDMAKAKKTVKAKAKGKSAPAAKAKGGAEKAPRENASQLFRDLIMEGKLTDDQIFAKVKAKYGLSDDKRRYVSWYRHQLRSQGKKPPEAKAE